MSRTALLYAVVVGALAAWAVMSQDYLPTGLLFVVGCLALLHLTGPRGPGKGGEDHQIREQAKARYGVNAPDHGPRF